MNTESQQNWTEADVQAKAAEIANCPDNDRALEILVEIPEALQGTVGTEVFNIIAEREKAKGGPVTH